MRNSFSFLGIILLYLICSLSCSKQTETDVKLRAIEAYIQEDPSRALEELSLINIDSLQYAGEQGLYSLLFSMALDKNYIDIKSDSLIAPALSYYSHHGDGDHSDKTTVMQSVNTVIYNSMDPNQNKTLFSYPTFSKAFVKKIFNRRDSRNSTSIGAIWTKKL